MADTFVEERDPWLGEPIRIIIADHARNHFRYEHDGERALLMDLERPGLSLGLNGDPEVLRMQLVEWYGIIPVLQEAAFRGKGGYALSLSLTQFYSFAEDLRELDAHIELERLESAFPIVEFDFRYAVGSQETLLACKGRVFCALRDAILRLPRPVICSHRTSLAALAYHFDSSEHRVDSQAMMHRFSGPSREYSDSLARIFLAVSKRSDTADKRRIAIAQLKEAWHRLSGEPPGT